uniref:HAT C-terminal dimerisation domain-containing protein n=1 Tax=Octopus bimaculoides TaxID=37653 RepID=A0A0L8FJV2_OCTBM
MVNTRVLNHQKFKSLLEDMEAEHGNVIYHNSVWWLSLGKMLKQVSELQNETFLFLDMKGLSCDFVTKMRYEEWRCEIMFAADMFEKLNEWNVTLQGKGLFVHEMFRHVRSFKIKVGLFARLAENRVPASVSSKIRDHLLSLEDEVTRRFQDFKKIEPDLNLLPYPFTADIDTAPEEVQLELTDMQLDHMLKVMFNSVTLIEFYKSLSTDKFPCLKKFAGKMFSIFGSTYVCEQRFSCMQINKSKNRSSVSDINMQAMMSVSTSNLTTDFKITVNKCDRLHLSH